MSTLSASDQYIVLLTFDYLIDIFTGLSDLELTGLGVARAIEAQKHQQGLIEPHCLEAYEETVKHAAPACD